MDVTRCTFQPHGDSRGKLIALEEGADIPFPIKRVYYIYDTLPGVERGFHAHRELEQILVCVSGSCEITVDDGRERETIPLGKPSEGLYIGPGIWREMRDFSPGAVLLVLASLPYDEHDYIRDYDEFIAYVARCEPDRS